MFLVQIPFGIGVKQVSSPRIMKLKPRFLMLAFYSYGDNPAIESDNAKIFTAFYVLGGEPPPLSCVIEHLIHINIRSCMYCKFTLF